MKIIAHRGLVNGPDKNKENTLPTIMSALGLGFDVEVDVWLQNNQLKLGHDKPGPTVPKWLFDNKKVWFHAKDIGSLKYLVEWDKRVFYHTNEYVVITSKRELWALPCKGFDCSYIVLPENTGEKILKGTLGICTDYAIKYRSMFK